jgi:hypothetical protein
MPKHADGCDGRKQERSEIRGSSDASSAQLQCARKRSIAYQVSKVLLPRLCARTQPSFCDLKPTSKPSRATRGLRQLGEHDANVVAVLRARLPNRPETALTRRREPRAACAALGETIWSQGGSAVVAVRGTVWSRWMQTYRARRASGCPPGTLSVAPAALPAQSRRE